MSVPEHLWRFPTREAIDSLATRFGLPNTRDMQDWEWEVADPDRLDEFLATYFGGELTDDEKFTIMETVLQCFEDLQHDLAKDPRWARVAAALDQHIDLHAYTVWYWGCVEDGVEQTDPNELFRITPWIREVLRPHRARLETPKP